MTRYSWKTEKLQHSNEEVIIVVDNENKEWKGHILNIVDKLNEQDEQIKELEENREILNKWKDDYVEKFTEIYHIVAPFRGEFDGGE